MAMHNPPHPGEFITAIYLEPYGVSGRELAIGLMSRPLHSAGSSKVTAV
jgi:plasmid maintenance system antidote protein VapI